MTKTKKTAKTQNTNEKTILNADVNLALRELVRISKRLVEFTDQETQCLVTNDYIGFAFSMQEKENLAHRYTQASEEFRERLEEFKTADKSMITQLNNLQTELKEKTESNNKAIDQVKKRAQNNTQATLFNAQELGQNITFPGDAERAERRAEKMKKRQMESEVRA